MMIDADLEGDRDFRLYSRLANVSLRAAFLLTEAAKNY